jgi:predicted MFS family arabinose efflux permease
VIAISFFGVQMLLKILYVLRLGYGPEYVGWYNGTGALVFMAMGLPSGALGTRFGGARTMLVGGIAAVVGMALLPVTELVPSWAQPAWPFLSQLVLTCGWSMFTVNLVPSLTLATAEGNRQQAYALNNALVGLGTLVGTLAGGLLPGMFAALLSTDLQEPAPYRLALFVGAGLATLSLIPLSLSRRSAPAVASERARPKGRFPLLPVALIIAYIYLRHAGWATCQAFCNAYMDTDLQLPTATIGLITGSGQLLAILASLLTPRLTRRWGNALTLALVTVGTALFLLPMALVSHWSAASFGRLGILVLSAIWLPALQVFQMDLVDSEWRTIAYGSATTAMGFGFGSISLAGGYIIEARGYNFLFMLGVLLSLAAGALMWAISKSPISRRA